MPQTPTQKEWAKRRKLEAKEHLRRHKERPCADCGQAYPYYVMQLDHVSGRKVDSVSRLIGCRRFAAAIAEIEKCEVVCSNCHAARTWSRANEGM